MSKKSSKWVKLSPSDLNCSEFDFLFYLEVDVLFSYPVRFGLGFREKYVIGDFHHRVKDDTVTTYFDSSTNKECNVHDIRYRYYFSINGGEPIYQIRDLNRIDTFFVLAKDLTVIKQSSSNLPF